VSDEQKPRLLTGLLQVRVLHLEPEMKPLPAVQGDAGRGLLQMDCKHEGRRYSGKRRWSTTTYNLTTGRGYIVPTPKAVDDEEGVSPHPSIPQSLGVHEYTLALRHLEPLGEDCACNLV